MKSMQQNPKLFDSDKSKYLKNIEQLVSELVVNKNRLSQLLSCIIPDEDGSHFVEELLQANSSIGKITTRLESEVNQITELINYSKPSLAKTFSKKILQK